MENLTLDVGDMYEEIKTRALDEGAYSVEEWDDIVEEIIDEKREFNEMSDDEAVEVLRESLRAKYDDFRTEVPEM